MTDHTLKLGSRRCQCGACSARFNSVVAFDKHRVGKHGPDRRCLTEGEMLEKGMIVNAAGYWVSSAAPAGLIVLKQDHHRTE